jgi:hypothetical protein
MKAATLKALALHTADDVAETGPDYKMGWGIMNAKNAAELLRNKKYSSIIEETNLKEGHTFSLTLTANGTENLNASISWTDPAANHTNSGILNDTTAALVNDLDIRITQNGVDFYPWRLSAANATAAATKDDNRVDPFERIEIPNAEGSYTLTVTHKSNLENGAQDFSLLVSGVTLTNCTLIAPEGLTLADAKANELTVQWNPVLDALYELQYKNSIADTWQTKYVSDPSITLKALEIDTEYIVRVRTFCSQNIASEYSMEYPFTFLGAGTELSFLEPLGLESDINFSIYPNPAVEYINLHNETSDSSRFSIVTTSGTRVKNGSAKNAKINVSDLASGLYILQVLDTNGKRSAKFYKQ